MQHATRHVPATSGNAIVTQMRGIPDPLERAAACQLFIANGRETIRAVEQIRGEAIRAARRKAPRPTVDELAERIKVRRNVVVDALRSPNGTNQ